MSYYFKNDDDSKNIYSNGVRICFSLFLILKHVQLKVTNDVSRHMKQS
jgi:hypothetical protein